MPLVGSSKRMKRGSPESRHRSKCLAPRPTKARATHSARLAATRAWEADVRPAARTQLASRGVCHCPSEIHRLQQILSKAESNRRFICLDLST